MSTEELPKSTPVEKQKEFGVIAENLDENLRAVKDLRRRLEGVITRLSGESLDKTEKEQDQPTPSGHRNVLANTSGEIQKYLSDCHELLQRIETFI